MFGGFEMLFENFWCKEVRTDAKKESGAGE
jgi:hypothetical protein